MVITESYAFYFTSVSYNVQKEEISTAVYGSANSIALRYKQLKQWAMCADLSAVIGTLDIGMWLAAGPVSSARSMFYQTHCRQI